MKKIIYGIIVLIVMFAIDVQAQEVPLSHISNGSYLIGKYNFTRDKTENYNGTLTVQHIMLAAKTIESDDIEDMKIYYKNSRGTWVDPITNKTISSNKLPEVFSVEYLNLEKLEYNYDIEYRLNGGNRGEYAPTEASADGSIIVSKPSKTFTVNIDANSQGASVTLTNMAVVSINVEQEFAGWTAENINPATAKYSEEYSAYPDNSWNGSTKVGRDSSVTSFRNLRNDSNIVTLIANWTATEVPLPIVEKSGYECSLNTNPQGSGGTYASGGTYMSTGTESSTTLYVRCTSKMLSSSPFLEIEKNDFESIQTVDNIVVPANAIDSWDASEAQNESIMAWYLDEDEDNEYELYIGQNGGVIANTYSDNLFAEFKYLESLDLSHFDTSYVTNMEGMFSNTGSTKFTLNLGDKFDTSNVTDMSWMFHQTGYYSTVFTLDLKNHFNTSNVTNMYNMFSSTGFSNPSFTLDLGEKFDTSNVTDMSYMFYCTGYSSTIFTLDLGNQFDTSSVTNMSYMFDHTGYRSTVFTLDLGNNFDTSNVTDMQYMFNQTGYNSTEFTLDLGNNFDTSKVEDMSHMFQNIGYKSTVFTLGLGDQFNTSKVRNMSYMFTRAGYESPVFTLNLGDYFDTSRVTDMSCMFESIGEVNTDFTLDLGLQFDTSNVTNMYRMFFNTGYNSNTFKLDLGNYFDTSRVTSMSYMFAYTGHGSPIFTLDLGDYFDTSSVTSMDGMFNQTGYKSTVFTLDLGDSFDTSNVTDMACMFYDTGYSNPSFTIDLGNSFDTSSVTNMESMFYDTGYSNPSFTLDLGDQFDTSNVIDMSYMFEQTGYSNPTFEIDITSFDFDSVTNYAHIFRTWKTTNTIWVKDAIDQNWIVTNSGNSNLTTSNVLIK